MLNDQLAVSRRKEGTTGPRSTFIQSLCRTGVSSTVSLSGNGECCDGSMVILMTLDVMNGDLNGERVNERLNLTKNIPLGGDSFARRVIVSSHMKMDPMT